MVILEYRNGTVNVEPGTFIEATYNTLVNTLNVGRHELVYLEILGQDLVGEVDNIWIVKVLSPSYARDVEGLIIGKDLLDVRVITEEEAIAATL